VSELLSSDLLVTVAASGASPAASPVSANAIPPPISSPVLSTPAHANNRIAERVTVLTPDENRCLSST
jgi:hypothetical protein